MKFSIFLALTLIAGGLLLGSMLAEHGSIKQAVMLGVSLVTLLYTNIKGIE